MGFLMEGAVRTSRLSFSLENCATCNGQESATTSKPVLVVKASAGFWLRSHRRSARVVAVPASQIQEIRGLSITA